MPLSGPALRPLGTTGLSVTAVGLGMASLGRPAYINVGRDVGGDRTPAGLAARSYQVLERAHRAGIRYVDVARSYGRAEEFLRSWLEERDPGDMVVGSKWGYRYVGEFRLDAQVHEVKDHSIAALKAQYAESRRLLGRHLRLYQVHSATLESGVLDNRPVLDRLAELREEGLVVGLSVSGARQAEVIHAAMQVDVDGVNPFSCVQATWNLLESSAGSALAEAGELGWGVIVKEALANGRLAVGSHPEVMEICRRRHTTPDAVAMAAALAQPWADVVLSGAGSVTHLESNMQALKLPLDEAEVEALTASPEEPHCYWQTRSELAWR